MLSSAGALLVDPYETACHDEQPRWLFSLPEKRLACRMAATLDELEELRDAWAVEILEE